MIFRDSLYIFPIVSTHIFIKSVRSHLAKNKSKIIELFTGMLSTIAFKKLYITLLYYRPFVDKRFLW